MYTRTRACTHTPRAEDVAQWVICLPSMQETLGLFSGTIYTGLDGTSCNPSILVVKTSQSGRSSLIQDQAGLYENLSEQEKKISKPKSTFLF